MVLLCLPSLPAELSTRIFFILCCWRWIYVPVWMLAILEDVVGNDATVPKGIFIHENNVGLLSCIKPFQGFLDDLQCNWSRWRYRFSYSFHSLQLKLWRCDEIVLQVFESGGFLDLWDLTQEDYVNMAVTAVSGHAVNEFGNVESLLLASNIYCAGELLIRYVRSGWKRVVPRFDNASLVINTTFEHHTQISKEADIFQQ